MHTVSHTVSSIPLIRFLSTTKHYCNLTGKQTLKTAIQRPVNLQKTFIYSREIQSTLRQVLTYNRRCTKQFKIIERFFVSKRPSPSRVVTSLSYVYLQGRCPIKDLFNSISTIHISLLVCLPRQTAMWGQIYSYFRSEDMIGDGQIRVDNIWE